MASPPTLAPLPSYENSNTNLTMVFDVIAFGAVGDSVNDGTQALKATWDAVQLVESATLLTPRGHSFMIQPTIFTSPCRNGFTFQVDGTLVPPDGPNSRAQNNNKCQWLVFYRADEMTLQGGGLIDGKWEKWWNPPCKPHRVKAQSTKKQ